MVLFRCNSIKEKNSINRISIGDFISTSLDFETAENFFSYDGLNVTFVINVPAGTPVLVIPYSIKLIVKDNKKILKVVANDNQNEVILFNDYMKFNVEKKDEENDEIFLCVNAETVNKNKRK